MAVSNEAELSPLRDFREAKYTKATGLKSTILLSKNPGVSLGREVKNGSVGHWIPVKNEENVLFHNFSPKSITFRPC